MADGLLSRRPAQESSPVFVAPFFQYDTFERPGREALDPFPPSLWASHFGYTANTRFFSTFPELRGASIFFTLRVRLSVPLVSRRMPVPPPVVDPSFYGGSPGWPHMPGPFSAPHGYDVISPFTVERPLRVVWIFVAFVDLLFFRGGITDRGVRECLPVSMGSSGPLYHPTFRTVFGAIAARGREGSFCSLQRPEHSFWSAAHLRPVSAGSSARAFSP